MISPHRNDLERDLAADPSVHRNRYVEIKGKSTDRSEEFIPRYPYLESMKGNKKPVNIKVEI